MSNQGNRVTAIGESRSNYMVWPCDYVIIFMFTIITICEQKTFQVPIMSYINLVAYVQQKIDDILYNVQAWAQIYINNIICNMRSLPNLFKKLQILFDILLHDNIFIKPTKSYLDYLNVRYLDQQVNSLGLTISDKKLRAIQLLTYPNILRVLEYFLGPIRYLRGYIHFYTQLATSFELLTTLLLCHTLIGGQ